MEPSGRLVSVVVPSFNRRDHLEGFITPILADPKTGEVIVVVDGSTDGSIEFLTEWSLRQDRIRAVFQENSGPAVARQRGVEAARCDVVLLLDDDVRVEPGLVTAHLNWHSDESNRLVLGYMPTHVPVPRRPGQASTIMYAEDYENTCRLYEMSPADIYKNLWAGNISMKRSDALRIGLRADGVLSYHEDLRFGIRCQLAGLEAVFDRSLLSWHWHRANLRKLARDARRSGRGRAALVGEFPDLCEDLDPLGHLSSSETLVYHMFGSLLLSPVVAMVSMAISFLAGRMRMWKLELLAARVLRLLALTSAYERAVGQRRSKRG